MPQHRLVLGLSIPREKLAELARWMIIDSAQRVDADHWKIPGDIAGRGMAYNAPSRHKDFGILTFSTLDLGGPRPIAMITTFTP